MLEILKPKWVFFLFVSAVFISCRGRTYDPNSNIVPTGINYSYHSYGPGTSSSTGAFVINIYSGSQNYNEYYVVNVYGVGAYTIQPGYNQLLIPNVWTGFYNFSVERFCSAGTASGCIPKALTGVGTISTETTTIVDVWL